MDDRKKQAIIDLIIESTIDIIEILESNYEHDEKLFLLDMNIKLYKLKVKMIMCQSDFQSDFQNGGIIVSPPIKKIELNLKPLSEIKLQNENVVDITIDGKSIFKH